MEEVEDCVVRTDGELGDFVMDNILLLLPSVREVVCEAEVTPVARPVQLPVTLFLLLLLLLVLPLLLLLLLVV